MAKKANSAAKGSMPTPVRVPDYQHASVSVRKISNGWLINESRDTPKGYTSTERFSPTKPKITMPSTASKPKR